jgi:hypothetical protein
MNHQHPSELTGFQNQEKASSLEWESPNSRVQQTENFETEELRVQTNSLSSQIKQEPKKKSPSLTDMMRNTFVRKTTFVYVHEDNKKIDTTNLLYKCLFFYLLEYLLLFAFQLISYLVIYEQWRNSSWVIGVVLAIVYVPVCLAIYYLQHKKERFILFVLKFVEFSIHFVFLGWAVAYVDFSFMALSYVMIVNIILLYIFVCS